MPASSGGVTAERARFFFRGDEDRAAATRWQMRQMCTGCCSHGGIRWPRPKVAATRVAVYLLSKEPRWMWRRQVEQSEVAMVTQTKSGNRCFTCRRVSAESPRYIAGTLPSYCRRPR